MKINTIRFGEIDIAEEKILTFENGLPGFDECFRFTIISSEETDPFLWLQSIEDPDVALAVINPFRLFPDYSPVVNEVDLEQLGNPSDDDVLALTVAVIPVKYELMTTNLLSPILINLKTNKAHQVIMENSSYQVREPIFDRVQQLMGTEAGDATEGGSMDAGSDT